jgi:hypothetical protein
MADNDSSVRKKSAQTQRDGVDGVNPVMEEKNLALTVQLALDRVADDPLIVLRDISMATGLVAVSMVFISEHRSERGRGFGNRCGADVAHRRAGEALNFSFCRTQRCSSSMTTSPRS